MLSGTQFKGGDQRQRESKMNYKQSLLETITKHPSVSRAMSGKTDQLKGVYALVKVRRALRDVKRAKRNAREERGYATPESGVTGPFASPSSRLIQQALEDGLPLELQNLCLEYLSR